MATHFFHAALFVQKQQYKEQKDTKINVIKHKKEEKKRPDGLFL